MNDDSQVLIRKARAGDVPAIVALFAADEIGGHSDTADPQAMPEYLAAFARIEADRAAVLWVAERDGAVVGTFQTNLGATLTSRGRLAMTVQAVQVRADLRSLGIGEAMMRFAIDLARAAGCLRVQLSSNAARTAAHRFYERLGFAKSHVAFKMKL